MYLDAEVVDMGETELIRTGLGEIDPIESKSSWFVRPSFTLVASIVVSVLSIWVLTSCSDGKNVETRSPASTAVTVTKPASEPRGSTTIPESATVDIQVRPVLGIAGPVVLGATSAPPEGVELAHDGTTYILGAPLAEGALFESVKVAQTATDSKQWQVQPIIRAGSSADAFNAAAAQCFAASATCPSLGSSDRGQLALVADGSVIIVASVQTRHFERDQITIAGGFTEHQAERIARMFEGSS